MHGCIESFQIFIVGRDDRSSNVLVRIIKRGLKEAKL